MFIQLINAEESAKRFTKEHGIPQESAVALARYLWDGIRPGRFLEACLCNDLSGAVGYADDTNFQLLRRYMGILYWEIPMSAWGNRKHVEDWLEIGGLNGMKEKEK